jgi:antitoxin MazE
LLFANGRVPAKLLYYDNTMPCRRSPRQIPVVVGPLGQLLRKPIVPSIDIFSKWVVHCIYIGRSKIGKPMIKKLKKHGNSLAVVIDRAVLDLLKIDADTPLEISTDGQVLVISPVRDNSHREKFTKALESANRKYGRALKRLAE